MRLATLGTSLEYAGITRINYRSSVSLLDFDVVIWSPADVFTEYDNEIETSGFAPVLSASGSNDFLVTMRRRKVEMHDFIKAGHTLVIIPPLSQCIGAHTFEEILYFDVLNLIPKVTLKTEPFDEIQIHPAAGEPFRTFAEANADKLTVKCYLSSYPGQPIMTDSSKQHVLASYMYLQKGHLLIVPSLTAACKHDPAAITEFANSLAALLNSLAAPGTRALLPTWATEYMLSGETDLRERIQALRNEYTSTLLQLERLENQLTTITERKELLSSSGVELVGAVSNNFRAIGAITQDTFSDENIFIVELENILAVVLVLSRNQQVSGADLQKLLDRQAEYSNKMDMEVSGIVIANIEPERPLSERTIVAFAPELDKFAKEKNICCLTSQQLLALLPRSNTGVESKKAELIKCLQFAGIAIDN